MGLDRSIIKAQVAQTTTYDFKPKDLALEASEIAKDFVSDENFKSDFRISELVAKQAGISELQSGVIQEKINVQVLEKLKEVQEAAYKEGYELGLIEGTEKAYQEAKIELAEKIVALGSVLKNLEELKQQLLIDNEAELIKLVFLTAKKIAIRDLEEHRDAVKEIILDVVSELKSNERLVVRLSNEDLYFIETLQDKSDQRLEALERVKFITDDTIKSGGCLIETEFGSVNATIEERVERVWQTLQSRIPQNLKTKKE